MRRLYLLRHAKSSWADVGTDDFDRPLDPRGERAAAAMAVYCRQIAMAPGRVVCSPAARTRATWEWIAAELPDAPSPEFDRRIYEASPDRLRAVIGETPVGVGTMLLVGHNPGMERLAGTLTGDAIEKFPTGALATLEFAHGGWDLVDGAAQLIDLMTPKALV